MYDRRVSGRRAQATLTSMFKAVKRGGRIPKSILGGAAAAGGAAGLGMLGHTYAPIRSQMRSSRGAITTRQNDVTYSKRRSKRKMSKSQKKRVNRFKKRVKRALRKPSFRVSHVWSVGRSFKSPINAQGLVFIPFCGFRGPAAATASVSAASAGGTGFIFRGDICRTIVEKYANDNWKPVGPALNSTNSQWWVNMKRAVMDMSVTNSGGTEAGGNTNNAVEYDIYHIWPKHKFLPEQGLTSMFTYNAAAVGQEEPYGGELVTPVTTGNVGFEPWQAPFANKWYGIKKIANGYVQLGETFRMNKSLKLKRFFTQRNWETEDLANLNINSLGKGLGGALVVAFRGAPAAGRVTGGYPCARLTFNLNHSVYCTLPSYNQGSGGNSTILYVDDLA